MAHDAPAVLREGGPWGASPVGCAAPSPTEARDGLSGLPWGMCGGGSWCAAPWGPQSHSLTVHLFMCPVGVRAAGQGPWGHAWGVQIRGKARRAGSLLRPSRVISALSSWKSQTGQKESHCLASSVSLLLGVSRMLVFFPNSQSCMNPQVQAWRVDGTLAATAPHRALSPATRHTGGAVHTCP